MGEIHTFHNQVSYLRCWPLGGKHLLAIGVEVRDFRFDAPEATPVPDHLGSVAVRVGHTQDQGQGGDDSGGLAAPC